jgi:lipopolysaccharide export system protein LptA
LLASLLALAVLPQSLRAENSDKLFQAIDKNSIEQKTKETLPQQAAVDIVADEISYNQETSFYLAQGQAEAILTEKNATLFADKITYDNNTELLEAFGNVKIVQGANQTYGSYASFKIDSGKYQLDEPRIFIPGIKIKARVVDSTYYDKSDKANKKKNNDLVLKNGVISLDQPIAIYSYAADARTHYSKDIIRYNRTRSIDWNDLSDKSHFNYKAKEIFVDNTRKTNNLRIKGARIKVGEHFSIPCPVHITTSVGDGADTRFKGPVIGNRERIGGFALGPRFYHETKPGIFSFVPIIQLGNGPAFGGGGIASFNTPGDTTALMIGYGSLYNRVIGSAHQEIIGKKLQANVLVNQFQTDNVFGSSQVGQLYELASDFRLFFPFIDEKGMRVRFSGDWAKDNIELFSAQRREDLSFEREEGKPREEHSGFKTEVQTSFYTEPVARYGNELYNASLRGRGQGALRFYDTGDFMSIARFGPALEARVDNFSFEVDYLFAAIAGESPFLYDQFFDGNQSFVFDGDYKVNQWFSIGTSMTYNVDRSRVVRNEVRTEVGPQDFKVRLSYDTILNQVNLGFNMLFGDPVAFDQMRIRVE